MNDKEHVQTAIRAADRILRLLDGFRPEIRDITLKCPEEYGTASFQVAPVGQNRRARLDDKAIRGIEVVSLSQFRVVPDAAQKREDGWTVDFPPDEDTYGMRIDFDITDRTLMRRLVLRDHDREPRASGDDDVYWMSAQLRNLEALTTSYGRVSLRDVDFLVNVSVHSDVKAKVPRAFVRQMELSVLLVKEKDRNKKLRLMWEQLHLQRTGPRHDKDVLSEIQDLFLPTHFSRFLQVTNQFRFADVKRGTDASERSIFPTFPKSMTVVSKTDLSVTNPASNGQVVYRKSDLQKAMGEFFPKLAGSLE